MPTLSASNRTQVAYKLEGVYSTNWGTLQGGNGNLVRVTGESLDYNISTEQSKELRSDRQVTDTIPVSATAQGGINFELSYREFDWLLPDPQPIYEDDPRNGFYQGLAAEFGEAAQSVDPDPPMLDLPDPDPVRPRFEPEPH